MLSRTADSLYWLARYVERAENIARIVNVGYRMATMASSLGNPSNEWHSTLVAAGCEGGFFAKYGRRRPRRSSTIWSAIPTIRRASSPASRRRGAMPAWCARRSPSTCGTRSTRPGSRRANEQTYSPTRVTEFLDWVKERSLLFNGAYANTMLRNDAFFFTRLGTHHRAGGQHGAHPRREVSRAAAAARRASAARSTTISGRRRCARSRRCARYHWVYHERLQPKLIAELLILRSEMPRSLLSCYDQVTQNLDLLADAYGGKRGECHRLAGEMHARLRYGQINQIMNSGLHEFLTEFIDRSVVLGNAIGKLYLT